MQQVIRFSKRRMLSLEGRKIIFKTLIISKIVYLAFLNVIPNSLIEELKKIQETFIWHSSRPKINHKTLCNNFENGGLNHVDISSKNYKFKKYIYIISSKKFLASKTLTNTGK